MWPIKTSSHSIAAKHIQSYFLMKSFVLQIIRSKQQFRREINAYLYEEANAFHLI